MRPWNDAYEREADQAARAVTAGRALPRISDLASTGPHGSTGDPSGPAMVQPDALPSTGTSTQTTRLPPLGHGQPLPASIRADFEPRFGHAFGDVRVHSDAAAGSAARRLNARAFTLGRDIVFGDGHWAPETSSGRRLIAHELTHVVQQRGLAPNVVQRDGPTTAEVEPETEDAAPAAATTDPNANELLDTLALADRQRLRVVMSLETVELDPNRLSDLFAADGGTRIGLPGGATPRFNSSIPEGLKQGLTSVAGLLSRQALTPNRIVTVPLDLTAWGGGHAAYRFTYVERPPASEGADPGREILIERLGTVGSEGLSAAEQTAAEARFQRHGFVRGSGWSSDEYPMLLEAVALVPDSLLALVPGITFDRESVALVDSNDPSLGTDPEVGGDYDEDRHAVTLYDRAFEGVSNRTGLPGGTLTREPVRAIAHEIGHAIEKKALRDAWALREQAVTAFRDAFGQYETSEGSGQYEGFPASEQARFNRLLQAAQDAEQDVEDARSASGYRMERDPTGTFQTIEGGTATGSNAFRQAAAQDGGVRISTYSDQEWQEHFAEAFSLYITDPETLERLRPNVYAYFTANYPR